MSIIKLALHYSCLGVIYENIGRLDFTCLLTKTVSKIVAHHKKYGLFKKVLFCLFQVMHIVLYYKTLSIYNSKEIKAPTNKLAREVTA